MLRSDKGPGYTMQEDIHVAQTTNHAMVITVMWKA